MNKLVKIETPKTGATKAVEQFEISDEVKKLLGRHGVSIYPPGTMVGDKSIKWEGRGFVLPAEPGEVNLEDAGKMLIEKSKEEREPVRVYEKIDALPWDGAQAFQKAVEFLFGWGITRPTPGFFGPTPPVLRSVKTGPGVNDTIQVFWGSVEIPQLGCTLQTTVDYDGSKLVFAIGGNIPKGKRHYLETLVALTRIFARERSIYKGKAIRMFVDEEGDLNFDHEPEFLDADPTVVDNLIFTKTTMAQIETNLLTPIRYPEVCRLMGIPLKRGVLLEGPYGTGKTMTAKAAAGLAVANGWTFIMINRVTGLQAILDFAHRYAPVVVFAEDVDRVISGQERTVSIDDILNTLDGVQSKDHDVITVLTSNHANKISPAMLRPGRLDAIISMELPDAECTEKLIRMYGGDLITVDVDLTQARDALAGRIPAVIREAVERAKLSAIARTGGQPEVLTDEDLLVAADTMNTHLELLYAEKESDDSIEKRLGSAMVEAMRGGLTGDGKFQRLLERTEHAAAHAEAGNNRIARATPLITQTHEKVMTTQATPAKQ